MMWNFLKNLFSGKNQRIDKTNITDSVVIQSGGDVVIDPKLSEQLVLHKTTNTF